MYNIAVAKLNLFLSTFFWSYLIIYFSITASREDFLTMKQCVAFTPSTRLCYKMKSLFGSIRVPGNPAIKIIGYDETWTRLVAKDGTLAEWYLVI